MIPTIDVICRICSETYRISEIMLEPLKADGSIKREERQVDGAPFGVWCWIGTCLDCQRRKASRPKWRGTVEQEQAYYLRLIRVQHEQHPGWSWKRCQKAAASDFHNPDREPNITFRLYLTGEGPPQVASDKNQVTAREVYDVRSALVGKDITIADLTRGRSPFDEGDQSVIVDTPNPKRPFHGFGDRPTQAA